jgi:hypothetical protein
MSSITVVNNAQNSEVVRVAIYKKPTVIPTLDTIAWRIVNPPPNGGQTLVNVPDNFAVYANYPTPGIDDPTDPTAGNRTAILPFGETTARFLVSSSNTQDRQATAASITQVFTGLVLNEVRIENNFSTGVWTHLTKDGDDIYAPQVLWPGAVRMEDIRASLYLAVVSQFVFKGSRLVDEEIQLSETEILEGQIATVTGSMWKGYTITVT